MVKLTPKMFAKVGLSSTKPSTFSIKQTTKCKLKQTSSTLYFDRAVICVKRDVPTREKEMAKKKRKQRKVRKNFQCKRDVNFLRALLRESLLFY